MFSLPVCALPGSSLGSTGGWSWSASGSGSHLGPGGIFPGVDLRLDRLGIFDADQWIHNQQCYNVIITNKNSPAFLFNFIKDQLFAFSFIILAKQQNVKSNYWKILCFKEMLPFKWCRSKHWTKRRFCSFFLWYLNSWSGLSLHPPLSWFSFGLSWCHFTTTLTEYQLVLHFLLILGSSKLLQNVLPLCKCPTCQATPENKFPKVERCFFSFLWKSSCWYFFSKRSYLWHHKRLIFITVCSNSRRRWGTTALPSAGGAAAQRQKGFKAPNITSFQSQTTFGSFETFRGGGGGERKRGGVRFLPLSSWKNEISAKRCGDFHPCSCIIPSCRSLRPSRFRRPDSNMSSNTCCWRRPAATHTFTASRRASLWQQSRCGRQGMKMTESCDPLTTEREKKLAFVFLLFCSAETSHNPRLF